MSTDQKETREFQAEVSRLLHLMIHSLYSNKEIFLRELISNANDACDRLRFESLSNEELLKGDADLRIQVEIDEPNRTLIIRDNGIGMTREEVIQNIGTIARSGTKAFMEKLSAEQVKDASLIGQFGVGFYSSFIVADRVTLLTRRAGAAADQGVRWESEGVGSYVLEPAILAWRGTEVRLHLREGEDEFLQHWRLSELIKKYSDHVALPVQMQKLDDEGKTTSEWEMVNKASALWRRSRQDISESDYQEFYRYLCHDPSDAAAWSHFRVEGKLDYTALLYLPQKPLFDLFDREAKHGVKLYVQRVFIMDDAERLLPRYLRFMRGVIDSNDLPLNVSRELLQGNRVIDSIRAGSTKKVLSLLADLKRDQADKYRSFWKEYGAVLKEGPGEDYANRDEISELLLFSSTHEENAAETMSLADYVSRMKPGQKKIYYITADNYAAACHSPHLEVFRKRGIEVLLMFHRVDEWLMSHLREYQGKPFQSVAKGELDLEGIESADQDKPAEPTRESQELTGRIRKALGDKVHDVRVSQRLTRSPSCIVLKEHEMALYMQHLLKQAGHELPGAKPVLEINVEHPLLKRLVGEGDETRLRDWSEILLDQAILAEGGQLEDPAGFVSRLNDLVLGAGA